MNDESTGRHSAGRQPRSRRRGFPGGAFGLVGLVAVVLAIFGVAAYVLPPSIADGGDRAAYDASLNDTDRDDVAADPAGARGAPRAGEEISGEAMFGANPSPTTASPSPSPSKSKSSSPSPKPTGSRKTSSSGGGSGSSGGGSGASSKVLNLESAVVAITNEERTANGCGKVTMNEKLRKAARGHSQDMADQNYFAHDSLDGRSPWDRAGDAGYDTPIGENIAKGQQTAEAVMESWMNSEGHRRNILNCDAEEIGVGLAYDGGTPIWTQMFGAG